MNGQSRGRRAKWARAGLALAVVIAAHVLNGGRPTPPRSMRGRSEPPRRRGARRVGDAGVPGIVLAGSRRSSFPVVLQGLARRDGR